MTELINKQTPIKELLIKELETLIERVKLADEPELLKSYEDQEWSKLYASEVLSQSERIRLEKLRDEYYRLQGIVTTKRINAVIELGSFIGTGRDLASKAFVNWHPNNIRFTFPNGYSLSILWSIGTYSDNHFNLADMYTFAISNQAEIALIYKGNIVDDTDTLSKKCFTVLKDHEEWPAGYLTINQVVEVLSIIKDYKPRPSKKKVTNKPTNE